MKDSQQLLTWNALLSRWTDFARSSLTLPRGGQADKIRRAVPALVGLQGVMYALSELPLLAFEEQSFANERSALLIRRYEAELVAIWGAVPLPHAISECLADARASLSILEATLHNWA